MGYQWADDKTLQGLGWKDDDISSMKARTEFDPQEIQNLYSVGALKAPYAEYLKKQEALRRQAEEEAARAYAEQASYGDSEPSYYEAPVSAPAPTPAPQPSYGVGFDQLDSDSMAQYKASLSPMSTNRWGTGRGSY